MSGYSGKGVQGKWRQSRYTRARLPKPPRVRLFSFSHRGGESHANQQTFRRDEAADGLAPGLLLVLDQHVIALGFKRRGGAFDAFHLELEPGLRGGNGVGPGVLAETGAGRLRQGPESKTFGTLYRFRMKVGARLFFEGDAETVAVELATLGDVAIDRAKPGDK